MSPRKAGYGRRTDLAAGPLPVQTGPSTEYGKVTASRQAQKILPVATAGSTAPGPATTAAPGAAPAMPAGPPPPPPSRADLGDLFAPTDNPDEHPNTPWLPGAGLPSPDMAVEQLRALYRMTPSDDLLRLLEIIDEEQQ